jgi:hypothetical protein
MASRLAAVCLVTLLCTAGTVSSESRPAQGAAKPSAPKVGPVKPPTTTAAKIRSAMSAAPLAVAKDATILDIPSMAVLRQGTNGWTCIPDGPSPGVDPMCMDQNGFEWAKAWMNHQPPPADKMGFGYMLAGGSDASNTDPFAEKPNTGDRWVDTGPHVMVLNIGDRFAGYPTVATNTKVPYVMWAGTPYAHLMIPIK